MSCSSKKDTANEAKIFRYNQHTGITSLDPAFSKDQSTMWACNQIFDGLVQVNDDLEVVPAVARSWDVSNDGKSYTFHLRDDVVFHDHELFENGKGRKVNANDFVFSFYRLLDPEVASTGGWLFRNIIAEQNAFVAKNDSTFVINLNKPFRPLLGILTLQYASVVPEEVVNHFGKDFRINPIGCGPFQFKSWIENEALFLTKNQHYHEKKNGKQLPLIDGIRVSFLVDRAIEFNQLIQGKIDIVSGIDPAYKDKALDKNGGLLEELKEKMNMHQSPYLNTEYFGILMEGNGVEALKDRKVRQAMNYAIDRESMIEYLRNNIGIPAHAGMIPSGLPSYNDKVVKGYHYDVDKAKQLLNDAGFPAGEGIGEITIFSNSGYKDIATYVAKALTDIGLQIKIENIPAGFQRERMRKKELDVFRASWIADYPDGESYLSLFYGQNDAPPNYTSFKNEEYDDLYEKALLTADPKEYIPLYQQMDQLIVEEAPVIVLYYDEVIRFVSKRVNGLKNNAMNLLELKNIDIIN